MGYDMPELLDLKIGDFVEFVDLAPDVAAEPRPMSSDKTHWAVCQTFSNRVHRVRPEIEKANRGTFLPTYARLWSKGGLPWSDERQLMPGYVFFLTEPEKWGEVRNIEGVYSVLTNDASSGKRLASKVLDGEMCKLVLDHAMGVHNRFESGGLGDPKKKRYGKRRRRPRHGKRMREAA